MPTMEISEGLKFHITIDEIVQVIRLISKQTKQHKVRAALKQMLRELKKANQALVDEIFVPLHRIDSKEDFGKKIKKIRIKFKRMLESGRPVFTKISCSKVTQKLNALKASQQWKKHIPIIKHDIMRLELLADSWIANDSILYEADANMMKEINDFMDSISNLAEKKPAVAYNKYKAALKDIEEQFLGLRNNLAELEILSGQL